MTFENLKSKIDKLEISLYLGILGYWREDLRELIDTSQLVIIANGVFDF